MSENVNTGNKATSSATEQSRQSRMLEARNDFFKNDQYPLKEKN